MRGSLNLSYIKKLDKSNMLGLLLDFPQQCRIAKEIAERAEILFTKRDFSRVVCAGLGGSAIGADLVRSYLYYESKIPILVVREYDIPAYVDRNTLVIISSYSGNTEETLSSYEQARKAGATLIAISSGGQAKENALRDKITFIEIPQGLPPRCALGYTSIIPLYLLGRLGLCSDAGPEINRMANFLEELRDNNIGPRVGQKDNIAKSIAGRIFNKMVFIYASSVHFDAVATRVRGQIAENSKALASAHVLPEMNHNEIVGWESPRRLFKNFVAIFLKDNGAHPRVLLRMDISKALIKKEGVEVIEVSSRGEDLLSRIFSLIYIGDIVSFYLAILYGRDPTPVERITYLKNELAKYK